MLPIAQAGFSRDRPDQRGYGRTTGWDADYDGDLGSFRMLNLVRDALGLVSALGYRSVAAVFGTTSARRWRLVARSLLPDVVSRRGTDERAVWGPAAAAIQYRRSGAERRHATSPAGVLDDLRHSSARASTTVVLLDAPGRRKHALLPQGIPRVSARLLPLQERGLETEQAPSAQVMERRRAGKTARNYVMDLHQGWPKRWQQRCRRRQR